MRHVELLRRCTDGLEAYASLLPKFDRLRVRLLTAIALTAEEGRSGSYGTRALELPISQAIAWVLQRDLGDSESQWEVQWRSGLHGILARLESEPWESVWEALKAFVAKMSPLGGVPNAEAYARAAVMGYRYGHTAGVPKALEWAEVAAQRLPEGNPERAEAFAVVGVAYDYLRQLAQKQEDPAWSDYAAKAERWLQEAVEAARAFTGAQRAFALLGVAYALSRAGRAEETSAVMGEAADMWDALDDCTRAHVAAQMGRIFAVFGEYEAMVHTLGLALTVAFSLPNVIERVYALREVARVIRDVEFAAIPLGAPDETYFAAPNAGESDK